MHYRPRLVGPVASQEVPSLVIVKAANPKPRHGGRIGFLDALRGVAVGFVLLQHVGQKISPHFRSFTTSYLQFGQLGVMLFFLCSGFIIPATLDRKSSFATFWTSRFWRLYPLYWLSLIAAFILATSGHNDGKSLRAQDWLANITMLQTYIGSPNAIGLYWSLAYEMFFYAIISALFLLGLHRRSVLFSLLACGNALALSVFFEQNLHLAFPESFYVLQALFALVTMFTGTVFYRYLKGTTRFRSLVICTTATLMTGVTLLFLDMHGQEGLPSGPKVAGFRYESMMAAWLGAYLLFGVGFWLRHKVAPIGLRFLGTISYSVYLLQGVVLLAIPESESPLISAVLWVVCILTISTITYHYVERPAIAIGRHYNERRRSMLTS